jgi:hypothetical protein
VVDLYQPFSETEINIGKDGTQDTHLAKDSFIKMSVIETGFGEASSCEIGSCKLGSEEPDSARQWHFLRGHLPEVSFGENLFSLRERRNVGLEGGSHLLQVSKSQAFGIAKTVAVALMMDATIGRPIGSSGGS